MICKWLVGGGAGGGPMEDSLPLLLPLFGTVRSYDVCGGGGIWRNVNITFFVVERDKSILRP